MLKAILIGCFRGFMLDGKFHPMGEGLVILVALFFNLYLTKKFGVNSQKS